MTKKISDEKFVNVTDRRQQNDLFNESGNLTSRELTNKANFFIERLNNSRSPYERKENADLLINLLMPAITRACLKYNNSEYLASEIVTNYYEKILEGKPIEPYVAVVSYIHRSAYRENINFFTHGFNRWNVSASDKFFRIRGGNSESKYNDFPTLKELISLAINASKMEQEVKDRRIKVMELRFCSHGSEFERMGNDNLATTIEIAKKLGEPENTIKTDVAKSLDAIRTYLHENYPDHQDLIKIYTEKKPSEKIADGKADKAKRNKLELD